ncbi:MAG: 16S rRNA (uracil(1498)-N(3))-methyltransferase [Ruminococcaceae bacterium]|nr:16S rRNA (uracil(1498)-N(3))-methyltransferase [Oscillospiraceae bacterium]
MHRFFIDYSADGRQELVITGDDVAHISRVLRLNAGDEITVCDAECTDCICTIESITKSEVVVSVQSREPNPNEPPISVFVYQGVPKGDKLDTVVQKCVELGAVKIVPVAMKRSVAVIKDADKKQQRMQKIALEAAKQCGRARVPEVGCVMSFADAIKEAKSFCDLCLLPYEGEKVCSIKTVLAKKKTAKSICIFIGPEGGFDLAEVEAATELGFEIVSMGPRILRTETAPLAALTAVMYEMGDW